MFPNFKSLAQREQKRMELLEKVQLRVRQSETKRDMYSEASWGSDADKVINLNRSTDSSDIEKKKDSSSANINVGTNNNIANESTPSVSDSSTQTMPFRNLSDVQFGEDIPPTPADLSDASFTVDIPSAPVNLTDYSSGVSLFPTKTSEDDDDEEKPPVPDRFADQPAHDEARKWIRDLYKANHEWAALEVQPISMKDGYPHLSYYLGENAKLFSLRKGQKGKPRDVKRGTLDWIRTKEYIEDLASNMEDKAPIPEEKEKVYVDAESGTRSDNTYSKAILQYIFTKYQKLITDNDLIAYLVLKDKTVSDVLEIHLVNDKLVIFNQGTKRVNNSYERTISWPLTLELFRKNADEKNVDFKYAPKPDKTKIGVLGRFQEDIDEIDSGIATETDTMQADGKYTSEYENIINSYYRILFERKLDSIIKVKPFVKYLTDSSYSNHPNYYLAPGKYGVVIRNSTQSGAPVTGVVLHDFLKNNIRWPETFGNIVSVIDAWLWDMENIKLEDLSLALKRLRTQLVQNGINKKSVDIKLDNAWTLITIKRDITKKEVDLWLRGFVNLLSNSDIDSRPRNYYIESFTNIFDRKRLDQKVKPVIDAFNAALIENGIKTLMTPDAYVKHVKEEDIQAFLAHRAKVKAKAIAIAISKSITNDIADAAVTAVETGRARGRGIARASGSGLKGRGLRGAGMPRGRPKGSTGATGPPYHTLVRKGKTYNLNDIQNSGLASAYIYKQIGSKYIRIPDLNECKLNIVYASRKKVGPAREISPEFQSVLKDLVYNQNISQAAYDQLPIDDQKLFKEVLMATHIQHVFKDELPDPMANLRMEYDKLRGELLLGNDNPSIIKQLKTVTVDMYANRLISDSEFKDIIVRLI